MASPRGLEQLTYQGVADADDAASSLLDEAEELPQPRRGWLRRAGAGALAASLLVAGTVAYSRDQLGGTAAAASESSGLAESHDFAKGHVDLLHFLKGRSGNGKPGGKQEALDKSLIGKLLAAKPAGWCPGFPDYCKGLEYPQPYNNGEWPTKYDYEGTFPEGFIWGLGTAAYQIEGAYRDDGRGASIWDTFTGADTTGMPGADCSYCCKEAPCPINKAMVDKGATGNVAANHYYMYKADIALMKSMGLKHYRFSIAWPRLVPTGKVKDGVNEKAKAFYNDLIDSLLEAGITPYVTLYHWDLPQGLLDPGKIDGWWARDKAGKPVGDVIPHFVDFSKLCFEFFGDRVKTWVTFNEAWTFTFLASGYGKAPSLPEFSDMEYDPYVAGHNVLNAHAKVVELYRKEFQQKQGGQIGITNNVDWREPHSSDLQDVAACYRSVIFGLGWFAEPIFGKHGDYPPEMRELYGDRLPKFSKEESELLKGSADFFGLNHYGSHFVTFDPTSSSPDLVFGKESEDGLLHGESAWLYAAPWGFRKLLNWVKDRYDNPPIMVTEGGWSAKADTASEGAVDRPRLGYYANYTAEMLKAIQEDKVDIRGYFGWSLMDNFEWEQGYAERFGITYTEFNFGNDPNAPVNKDKQPTAEDQWRRRKDSSCFLEKVWATNKLVNPNDFKGCAGQEVFDHAFRDKESKCERRILQTGGLWGSSSVTVVGEIPKADKNETLPELAGKTCEDGKTDKYEVKFVRVSGTSITIDYTYKNEVQWGFYNAPAKSIFWSDGAVWEPLPEP